MAFELPALPYAIDALASRGVSQETLEYHHGKHHAAYVANLNKAIEGTPDDAKSLEEIILGSEGPKFNNAAQIWNHTFFWSSMSPTGGGAPSGEVAERIDRDFGSLDGFKSAFADAAATQFGSGWAWLVEDGGKLSVVKTPNAELPMTTGQKALVTLDVWEHAYYIDFRNARPNHIANFLDNLINWDFVAANLAG
ncbi:MAG: superoxide dismutase [Microthrixaceae bacterium]|nr:superoxide dismutase [Microthrixaceae bacterium]